MDMNRKHIGVDVGGTTINIAIVTPQGEIMAKESLKTTTYLHDNEKMILAIVSEIKSLLAENNVEKMKSGLSAWDFQEQWILRKA